MNEKKVTWLPPKFTPDGMPKPKHIGLYNVNRRIKLIFGDDYGCTVFSSKNSTTVIILLPKLKQLSSEQE